MDLETFKSIVFPAKDKLYRFAYRIVQSEEEAQDIVQEAFIKIWKNIEKLKVANNAEAWCMTVTKNLALDTIKNKKRKNTESLDARNAVMEIHDPTQDLDDQKDLMKRISDIINGLPDKPKQVIHLRDIEGYTYEEIAEILDITMSQVKVTLYRARRSVREELMKVEDYGI